MKRDGSWVGKLIPPERGRVKTESRWRAGIFEVERRRRRNGKGFLWSDVATVSG